MNISTKSITGNYRELNEDRIGVFKNKTDQMLLLVADGMGGHEKGEVAAQFVIDKIEETWINSNFFNEQELEPFLRDLVIKTNRALYLYSNEETTEHNMGTTLAMAVITDESIYVLNISLLLVSLKFGKSRLHYVILYNEHIWEPLFVKFGVLIGFIISLPVLFSQNYSRPETIHKRMLGFPNTTPFQDFSIFQILRNYKTFSLPHRTLLQNPEQ